MHLYNCENADLLTALRIMSNRESNSLDLPSEVDEEQDGDDSGDSENGEDNDKKASGNAGRFVTLQSLLGAGVLEPGEGAMTIDYLGQKFTGDLLLDGKIKSQETDKIYASPTAWAVSCKKIINPAKQSGCGWATVRYKGKKLDAYKNIWIKKQYDEGALAYDFMEAFSKNMIQQDKDAEPDATSLTLEDPSDPELVDIKQRIVVKHGILGNRQPSHEQNMLIESVTFASLGKIQPFLVSFTSNAALVVDFHCHLTTSEVVGYLAGTWDVNSHVVTISHAFPVRCRLGDFAAAPVVESEALQAIRAHGLTLLGWYHSHPKDPATPSLRDIDTQLDYQLKMKGTTDSAYLPCIGLICSSYNVFNVSMESQMVFYWVAPPPENRIHEYGKPMTMNHSLHQDESIPHEVLMEIKKCADFYKHNSDYVVFSNVYKKNVTYLEKLKYSISSKFPRNHEKSDELWNCLCAMATNMSDEPDTNLLKLMLAISNTPCISPDPEKQKALLTVPPLPLPTLPNLAPTLPASKPSRSSPTPHTPRRRRPSRETKPLPSLNNYFVGSDLASALFGASMGLDPATLSLLNLNSFGLGGMFMPPMPSFKPDPGVGLMKPPPPPSPFYPYATSRNSRSRSSSSSPSSTHRNSPSSIAPKDMPPPNKVPKIENNHSSPSNSKNFTSTNFYADDHVAK